MSCRNTSIWCDPFRTQRRRIVTIRGRGPSYEVARLEIHNRHELLQPMIFRLATHSRVGRVTVVEQALAIGRHARLSVIGVKSDVRMSVLEQQLNLEATVSSQSTSTSFKVTDVHFISEDYGANDDDFFVVAQCEIAHTASSTSRVMTVHVVGPERLSAIIANDTYPRWGNHYILSRGYDKRELMKTVQRLIDNTGCETWAQLHPELARHFSWV